MAVGRVRVWERIMNSDGLCTPAEASARRIERGEEDGLYGGRMSGRFMLFVAVPGLGIRLWNTYESYQDAKNKGVYWFMFNSDERPGDDAMDWWVTDRGSGLSEHESASNEHENKDDQARLTPVEPANQRGYSHDGR